MAVDLASCTSGLRTLLLVVSLLVMLLLDFPPRLDATQNLIRLPLRPYKVVSFPLVVVAHGPPEAGLESCTDYTGVVSTPYVIFVWLECRRGELYLFHAVGL